MNIFIVISSIFLISGFIWSVNRWLNWKICPLCAGVAGTWIWLLIGRAFGYFAEPAILGILMGGSVVGILYQAERRFSQFQSLLVKIVFVSLGFLAAYHLIFAQWLSLVSVLFILGIIVFILFATFSAKDSEQNQVVEELKRKMKNCC